mmetsp:Transcript_55141/g.124132  ORF Transcript_55141/g.124132 Transcript_55141/m.124132 type:complete len:1891 (+) Transcript_55141:150-5822(+)
MRMTPANDADSEERSNQPLDPTKTSARALGSQVLVLDPGDANRLARISVRGKERNVCRRSLFVLTLENPVRRAILSFVEWKWTDRFILGCIVVNSLLLGIYQFRAQKGIDDHYALNEFIDGPADLVLWAIFLTESVLKIIAWGLILNKKSYLRDPWNVLDFIVVCSGVVERIAPGGVSSLNVLRLFRLLRPLRSLNAVPQMKVLVNTVLSSILKLGNVIILGTFLFMVLGIVGISLMHGIFYRQCHTTKDPVLLNGCWSWNTTGEDRLCGGNYMCEAGGMCGGHEFDVSQEFRPSFPGGKQNFPWCDGSEPKKLFPETDFVHFDHFPGAFLLVFQCMTLEGWTDLMYMVEDSFSPWFAIIFFITIVVFTNFFLVNVALAVVDEVQDKFREEAEEEALANKAEEAEKDSGTGDDSVDLDPVMWLDCKLVRCCWNLSENEIFTNFILLIIFGNVINMCLARFSLTDVFGWAVMDEAIEALELSFLVIFVIEMFIMLIALGPKGYITNPITAFDGFVVVISIVEVTLNKVQGEGSAGLSALRTFRLFRVMNKLANKWSQLKVLLKAIIFTGFALNYWLILFVLVLYIFTLMWMSIFATSFHFMDPDALAPLVPKQYHGQEWCPDTQGQSWHFRQDCIPRAHFDTFIWGFVTVFQVMTGENWNTIMYAGMRASERWEGTLVPPTLLSAILFMFMILFGQILFLSLFLSMLISKFGDIQEQFDDEERVKRANSMRRANNSGRSIRSLYGTVKARMSQVQRLEVHPEEDDEDTCTAVQRMNEANVVSPISGDLPGQMPSSPHESFEPVEKNRQKHSIESDPDETSLKSIKKPKKAKRQKWPKGYAWFILSEDNPIRKAMNFILTFKTKGSPTSVFDNIILVCILLSTLCMMIDTPLSDPRKPLTIAIRTADVVFAVIFMIEMLIKLIALGLFWGKGTYLRSGWNWLDGIVVLVSIIDMASPGGGPGFLRVLRILRTFRPLRVISRNKGLKVVVKTLFRSMGDLVGLLIVSSLFLLIFALIFLMYLKGAMYQCNPGDVDIGFLGTYFGNLGENFVTPMCLGNTAPNVPGSSMAGAFNTSTAGWSGDLTCTGQLSTGWQRASADTPVCIGRCDNTLDTHPGIEHLCSKRYTKAEELPSACPNAGAANRTLRYSTVAEEALGAQYISDMQRTLVLPCGGSMVDSSGSVVMTGSSFSCQATFCRNTGSVSDTCKKECRPGAHKYFCRAACKDSSSAVCQSCQHECESACMCESFCTPLVKDAALCHEQGGSWDQVLSQNFDTIVNSVLTLIEISTTEGWVDVMYAAGDSTGFYLQPVRDNQHGFFVLLFPLWILLSFMFLVNLSVGVIVENFERSMKVKADGTGVLLTETQKKWVKSRKKLSSRAFFFDLTDLHLLPRWRRQVYDFVSCKPFEQFIMTAIVINTFIMGLQIFPAPQPWWQSLAEYANYIFFVIYLFECIVKLIALRCNYWLDSWNRFDFICVVATAVGIILKMPGINIDLGAATSVIRILRIARLFRLLRFLKELNRLFMCFFISIPKLYNVMMILSLFLVLFSILGMSLFGTAKLADTLNIHGNFQTFWRSFVTLFRASTGEAWNEIMHDLSKGEKDYFHAGDWCTPQVLFNTRQTHTYEVLEEKCLISEPNMCPGDWNPLAAFYWVAYTMLITLMILNLVVAVILQGYDEGKEDSESDNIDTCIEVWRKYDPNHKMKIPLVDALRFLDETISTLKKRDEKDGKPTCGVELPSVSGTDFASIARNMNMRKMTKISRAAIDMAITDENQVTFLSASKQVLRLMSMTQANELDLEELDECDTKLPQREVDRMHKMERRTMQRSGSIDDLSHNLLMVSAAQKIQDRFREKKARAAASASSTPSRGEGAGSDLRSAAYADVRNAAMQVPPRAG